MFLYNTETPFLLDNTGDEVLCSSVFNDGSFSCSLLNSYDLICLNNQTKHFFKTNLPSGTNHTINTNTIDGRFFVAVSFVSNDTVNNLVYEIVDKNFVLFESFEKPYFFKELKILKNNFGFSFVNLVEEINYFKDFSYGVFPGLDFHKGIDENFPFKNIFLNSTFFKISDKTKKESKIQLNTILGRSWFENNKESFILHSDFLSNFFIKEISDSSAVIIYLVTNDVAKSSSNGLFVGTVFSKTTQYAAVISLNNENISFQQTPNCFGTIDSKNIPLNCFFTSFDEIINPKKVFVDFENGKIEILKTFGRFKKISFTFNKNTKNIPTLESAYFNFNYDFSRDFIFNFSEDVTKYLEQFKTLNPIKEKTVASLTNESTLNLFELKTINCFSVLNCKLSFKGLKSVAGSPTLIFNDFAIQVSSFEKIGDYYQKNFSFLNKKDQLLSCSLINKNNDSLIFEGIKNFCLEELIIAFKKLYNFYDNFGVVSSEFVNDNFYSYFNYNDCFFFKIENENLSFVSVFDKSLKFSYLSDFSKIKNGESFKRKKDFGIAVSKEDFSTQDSFLLVDFKSINNKHFLFFKKNNEFYITSLEDLEIDNKNFSNFAMPESLVSIGTGSSEKVTIQFNKTKPYPFFPIVSTITDISSDFTTKIANTIFSIKGDVPGYFDENFKNNIFFYTPKLNNPVLFDLEKDTLIKPGNKYVFTIEHKVAGLSKINKTCSFSKALFPLENTFIILESFSTVFFKFTSNAENQNSSFSLFLFKKNQDLTYTYIHDAFYKFNNNIFSINEDLVRRTLDNKEINLELIGLLPDTEYSFFVVPTSSNYKTYIDQNGVSTLIRNIKDINDIKSLNLFSEAFIKTISVPNINIVETKKTNNSIQFKLSSYLDDEHFKLHFSYFKKPKTFLNGNFSSYHKDFTVNKNIDNKNFFDSEAYTLVPNTKIITINNVSDYEDVFIVFNFINKNKNNQMLFNKFRSLDSSLYFSGSFSIFKDILVQSSSNFIRKGFVFFFENFQKRNLALIDTPSINFTASFDNVVVSFPILEFFQTIIYDGSPFVINFDHRLLLGYNFYFLEVNKEKIKKLFVNYSDCKQFKIQKLKPNTEYKFFIEPVFKDEQNFSSDYQKFIDFTLKNVNYNKNFKTHELKSFSVSDFALVDTNSDSIKIQKPIFEKFKNLYPTLEMNESNVSNVGILFRIFDEQKNIKESFKTNFDFQNFEIGSLKEKTNYFIDATVCLKEKNFEADAVNFKPFSTNLKNSSNFDFGFEELIHVAETKKIKIVFSSLNDNTIDVVVTNKVGVQIPFVFTKTGSLLTYEFSYSMLSSFSEEILKFVLTENNSGFSTKPKNIFVVFPKVFETSNFLIDVFSNEIKYKTNVVNDVTFSEIIYDDKKTFFGPSNPDFCLTNLSPNSSYELYLNSKSFFVPTKDELVLNPVLKYKLASPLTKIASFNSFKVFKKDENNVDFSFFWNGKETYGKIENFDFSDTLINSFNFETAKDVTKEEKFSGVSAVTTSILNYSIFSFYSDSGRTNLFFKSEKVFLDFNNISVNFLGYKNVISKNSLLTDQVLFEFDLEPALSDYEIDVNSVDFVYDKFFIEQNTIAVNSKNKKTKISVIFDNCLPNDNCKVNFSFKTNSSNVGSTTLKLDKIFIKEKEYPAVKIENVPETVYSFLNFLVSNDTKAKSFLCELFWKANSSDSFLNKAVDTKEIFENKDFYYSPNPTCILKDGVYRLQITSLNSNKMPLLKNDVSTKTIEFSFKTSDVELPDMFFSNFTCEKEPIIYFKNKETEEFRSDYVFISNDPSVIYNDSNEKWISFDLKNWDFIILPYFLKEGNNVFFIKGLNKFKDRFSKIKRIEFNFSQDSNNFIFPNVINSSKFYQENDGLETDSSENSRIIKFPEDFTFTKVSYKIKNESGLVVSEDNKTIFSSLPRLEKIYIFTDYNNKNLADGRYTIELFLYDKNGLERKFVKQIELNLKRASLPIPMIKYDSQKII